MARNRELARIHVLKRDLGLDDVTYRDVLWAVARVKSAADLDEHGRRAVIRHMSSRLPRRSGFSGPLPVGEGAGRKQPAQPRRAAFGRAPHSLEQRPMLKKVGALLADHDRPWGYAESIARRMYRKRALEFCSDAELAGIIAALWRDANRHPEKSHANRDFRARCAAHKHR